MELVQEFDIEPVAKPRMTRRDKWNPSAAAQKYFAFKDEVKLRRVMLPECNAHIVFVVPMPVSWSEGKKAEMDGAPHQQVPDLDNFIKAIGDAVYSNDSKIWQISAEKRWGRKGKIIVKISNAIS